MQQETFESKIRGKLKTFERSAPSGSWESIQQKIHPSSVTTGSIFTSKLILGTVGVILLSFIGFQLSKTLVLNKDVTATTVFTHYWEALEVAQQENKPLLVLFTMDCNDCDSLQQKLLKPDVAEVANQYVQAQLPIDDETPIDSVFISQIPTRFRSDINISTQDDSITVQFKNSNALFTKGQVWKYLQASYEPNPQPSLAIFDHQNNIIQFGPYRPWIGEDASLKHFLDVQLQLFENGLFQSKSLFIANCAACHNRNMKDDLTGPALGGVTNRWKDYPRKDLYTFVRSSQQMIADGHPKAVEHWKKWRPVVMTNFPSISDQEMEQLLDFVEWRYAQN